jgi:4-amino-4-deoxy-L-arabinose transferase-like glycosyltransferase
MEDVTQDVRGSWVARAGVALCLTVLAGTLLFSRIGAYPLTDGDAGYYGRVARNILDSGDWGVLRFDPASPTSDVDKPPLGIWLTAAVFRALGPTDVAARLWHSSVALGLLALTTALARRIAGQRAALMTSAVLLTSALFFYQAREPMLDVPLAACLTAALWLLAGAAPSRFWPRYYAACAVVGAGVMIKGPVAAALASVPIAMMAAASARSGRLTARQAVARVLGGVGILLIVVLPWHIWMFLKAGPSFADMYAGTLTWRRYLEPQFPPGVAVAPYSFLTLIGLLPWAGLAVPALWAGWRDRRSQPALWYLCVYVVWTVAFFGLSPGKIIMRYILPAIPACAVLIGSLLARPESKALRGGAIATILVGVALVPAAAASGRIDIVQPGAGAIARAFLLVMAVTMAAGGSIFLRSRIGAGVAVLVAGATAAYLVLLVQAPPIVMQLHPDRTLAAVVNQEEGRRARVAVFEAGATDSMLAFYLDARLERLATGDEVGRFLSRPGRGWIVERSTTPLPPTVRQRLVTVVAYGQAALLRTRE